MPVNDNWIAVHACDFCGYTQFVMIDNIKDSIIEVRCARCGCDHDAIELVTD